MKIAQQAVREIIKDRNGQDNITDILQSLVQSSNGNNLVCNVPMLKTICELDLSKMVTYLSPWEIKRPELSIYILNVGGQGTA